MTWRRKLDLKKKIWRWRMENAEEEEKRCYCVRTQVLKTQVPSGYFAHISVPSLAN